MILATALFCAATIIAHGQPTNSQRKELPPKPLFPDAAPVCPCESLTKVSLPSTTIEAAAIDPLTLKGFHRPMPAVDILRLKSPAP